MIMSKQHAVAFGLSLPALVFYLAILAIPLASTFVLSLQSEAGLALSNYREIVTDEYFIAIFIRTAVLSVGVTGICVVLGTAEALILSRLTPAWRSLCLMVILGPLLISVIVRTLGWAILLNGNGPISLSAQSLGLSDAPVSLMYTMTGMIIALVHVCVPFVVLSVWVSLQAIHPEIGRAGASLGANPFNVIRHLILPRIAPGIISGSVVVFSIAATAFATPAIICGRRLKVAATTIYDEFLSALNWPLGAALAITLLVANIGLLSAYHRMTRGRKPVPEAATPVAKEARHAAA
jgi:putative spermidine/putrescine transport system permease protein